MKKATKKAAKKSIKGLKNLTKIFESADKSGLNWYDDAHNFCKNVSEKYNLPMDKVCAVVSSLSPGTNWEQNKKDTINLIESMNGNRAQFKFTTYGQNVIKAYRILDGYIKPVDAFNVTTGPKTFNFFRNILDPTDSNFVTIDRHAFRIATGKEYKSLTAKQYREVAAHYIKAAKKLDITPAQLQAVLWVDFRMKKEISFTEFNPF